MRPVSIASHGPRKDTRRSCIAALILQSSLCWKRHRNEVRLMDSLTMEHPASRTQSVQPQEPKHQPDPSNARCRAPTRRASEHEGWKGRRCGGGGASATQSRRRECRPALAAAPAHAEQRRRPGVRKSHASPSARRAAGVWSKLRVHARGRRMRTLRPRASVPADDKGGRVEACGAPGRR